MRNVNLLFITSVFSLMMIFTSCEDDGNDVRPDPESATVTIDASNYTEWVYFSFEEGQTVNISDYSGSMDWDLGFHRYDLRVNCGTSGPGSGGSLATGQTDFNVVETAPSSGYSMNDYIMIAVDVSSMPPVMERVPGDTVLANWISMKHGQMGPEYSYSNETFVIKTADGKYAKIWLKDYFNEDGDGGHITMKYSYQPDGSTKLD
jgi:hypothetical protein